MAPTPQPDPALEAWLDSHHVTWTYDPELPLDRIDEKRSHANQARVGEPLIADVVDRYTAAMRRGDQFPPIITHKPSPQAKKVVTLGGNHRHAAAQAAGHTTIAAYIIEAEPQAALAITYEDNARHGMPPSTAERIRQAVHLIGLGWTARNAAAAVGVSEAQVSQARKAAEGQRRARDLGVPGFDLIAAQATQTELARIPSDPVFEAAARATIALGLSVSDITQLVKRCKAQRSEADQLRIIGDLMEERAAEAQQRAGGRAPKVRKTPQGRLNNALVDLLDLSPAAIADAIVTPGERKRLRARIKDAMVRLNEVREAVS